MILQNIITAFICHSRYIQCRWIYVFYERRLIDKLILYVNTVAYAELWMPTNAIVIHARKTSFYALILCRKFIILVLFFFIIIAFCFELRYRNPVSKLNPQFYVFHWITFHFLNKTELWSRDLLLTERMSFISWRAYYSFLSTMAKTFCFSLC